MECFEQISIYKGYEASSQNVRRLLHPTTPKPSSRLSTQNFTLKDYQNSSYHYTKPSTTMPSPSAPMVDTITTVIVLVNATSCQNPKCTYNNPTYAEECEKCKAAVIN